jgi:hypothetical protein
LYKNEKMHSPLQIIVKHHITYYWNKWNVCNNEVVLKVSWLIHKVDNPHTDNEACTVLRFLSFQLESDNKWIIGTMHVEFYRGIEMTYIFLINHHSYAKISTYCIEGISGKFSVVISSGEGMCIKLCNYLLIVSARATVWIWVQYLKESRHYSIWRTYFVGSLSSFISYVFLNIVKMEFKFSFLVVVFLWTEYTKEGADED